MMPSPQKKRAKSKNDPARKRQTGNAFRRIIDVLCRRRVRHVVIGAQAVRAYVRSRATDDLDLLVAERDLDRAVAAADDQFEHCSTRTGGVSVLRDLQSGAEIHIRAALERSDQDVLESTIGVRLFARSVRVPAPEYLVVMKLASMRGRRKHWQDIISLIQADCIDVRFVIAHLVREHPGLIELFLELVEHATPAPRRRASMQRAQA